MPKITLYSTYCPKCSVLETKLKQKNVEFEICTDIEAMQSKGFQQVPMLGILEDGSNKEEYLDFGAAIKYVAAL